MKYSFTMLAIVCTVCALAKNDTLKTSASLQHATVYFGYGAELRHSAKISVNKATRFIVIDKISTQIDPNSLQISSPEWMSLMSQQYTTYTAPAKTMPLNPILKKMNDSLVVFQKQINALNYKSQTEELTLSKAEKMIENTIATSGAKTSLNADVLKLIDYYSAKAERNRSIIFELKTQIDIIGEKMNELRERIRTLEEANSQLQEREDENEEHVKTYGKLILQVMCNKDGEAPLQISYYTNNAGWAPVYDLRVNTAGNNLKLVYKAIVTQNTGMDWKQTKLTLSTGTPSFTNNIPILSSWYLQLYVPQVYRALEGKTNGVALRYNSNLKMAPQVYNDVKDGLIGQKDDNNDAINGVEDYTTLKQGLLNTNFEIDLPYDIASNNLAHSINIKNIDLPTYFKNYAVPKLDQQAYLVGELTNWENLDLLPGKANVIMDDTYIGVTQIDPNTSLDTLNLSLGKDKRVFVKRKLVKEESKSKKKDNDITQTFTYEITVRNNKSGRVNLVLKDQYPLSNLQDVEVKVLNKGDADAENEEVGSLTWQLNLKPGESRTIKFSYQVKYPKDKKISNF